MDSWTWRYFQNNYRVSSNIGRGSKELSEFTEKHSRFGSLADNRRSEKEHISETRHDSGYLKKIGSEDTGEAASYSIAKQFSGTFANSPKVSTSDVEAIMQMEHKVSESIVFLGAMAISAFNDLDDLLDFRHSDDWTSVIGSTVTASIACKDQGGYSGSATRTDYRKLEGMLVAENCKSGGITANGSLSWNYDGAGSDSSLLTRPHPLSFTFTNLNIVGPQGQMFGYSGQLDCDFGYISSSYTEDEALLSAFDEGYFYKKSFSGLLQPELFAPNCDFRDVFVTFNNAASHTLNGLKFISDWYPFQTGATRFGGEDVHYMLTLARAEMLLLIDASSSTINYISDIPDVVYTTALGNLSPLFFLKTTNGRWSKIANSEFVDPLHQAGLTAGTYSWESLGIIATFGWTIEGGGKIPTNLRPFDWIDALRSVYSNGSRCALLTNYLTEEGQSLTDAVYGDTRITLWEERILTPNYYFPYPDNAYSCVPINEYYIKDGEEHLRF